eukprot:7505650-Ditylum_brightwellii.AAC.1
MATIYVLPHQMHLTRMLWENTHTRQLPMQSEPCWKEQTYLKHIGVMNFTIILKYINISHIEEETRHHMILSQANDQN